MSANIRETANLLLQNEKYSFRTDSCSSHREPFFSTVEVKFNDQNHKIDIGFIINFDGSVVYRVFLMNICLIAYPKSLKKACDMFRFFKDKWQHSPASYENVFKFPQFTEDVLQAKDSESKAHEDFIDFVLCFGAKAEPQLQDIFKHHISLKLFERKMEELLSLENAKKTIVTKKRALEDMLNNIDNQISEYEKEVETYIDSTSGDTKTELINEYSAYKLARLE